jgi:hypothetical protein
MLYCVPSKTCTVSFGNWTHVTMASSLYEAGRNAWEWFQDPFWQGPKPTLDTIFKVRIVGQYDRVYRIRPRSFLKDPARPGRKEH